MVHLMIPTLVTPMLNDLLIFKTGISPGAVIDSNNVVQYYEHISMCNATMMFYI